MSLNSTLHTGVIIHQIELPTPFPVGSVNSYLIQWEDAHILVDCGPKYAPAREALLAGLARQGLAPADITALVLTHGHIDHVGLTALFQAEGVPVYAHRDVQTWLEPGGYWDEYRELFFSNLYRIMGMPQEMTERALVELSLLRQWNDRSVVDQVLEPGSSLPGLPLFEVLSVPGHAQAAIALWDAGSGVLLPGDQLLPHISSNALIEPVLTASSGRHAVRTKSLLQYRANMETLLRLPIEKVYPGHGDPFERPQTLLQQRLDGQRVRQQKFLNLLESAGPQTAYQLATTVFTRHMSQLSLIMSETIGHLDWLLEEGQVLAEEDDGGVILWRAHA